MVVRETVTEVLAKGYSVVVVDDCSKDDSKKRLAGLPVYYMRHRVRRRPDRATRCSSPRSRGR